MRKVGDGKEVDDIAIEYARCAKCGQRCVVTAEGKLGRHRLKPRQGETLGPWCLKAKP